MASLGQNFDRLFGWAFSKPANTTPEPVSFSPKESDDGAAIITASGAFGVYVDLDGTIRSEVELLNRYRAMEQVAVIDTAADEITDEVIVGDDSDGIKIVLDDLEQNDTVKKAIEESFDEILDLLDFRNNGYQIFKRWYIDGRLYFHVIIDEKNTADGIQELRYIDPRKIRKIKEVVKKQIRDGQPNGTADAVVTQTRNEYYVYSDKGFNLGSARPLTTQYPITGLKIAKDAILHCTSGLVDAAGTMTLSYLHKAIKPLNMFSTLKDAALIYRLARSPGRRVWSIPVGDLPRFKAEQAVRDIMTKYRNKLNYDGSTGEIRDDRKFLTMLEDFWLPVRGDGQKINVENLEGQGNFADIDDILFFQKELYAALHVPLNRLNQDDMFSSPVATEVTRDEIRFGKFIVRLRRRFAKLFLDCLEKQLVLKNVMTLEDFKKIKNKIDFQFTKDNYFMEAKENQVETMRITLLTAMIPFIGRFYSNEWVRKNVLKQTDEEIEDIDSEIQEEESNPQYAGIPGQPQEEGQDGGEEEEQGDGAGLLVDPNEVPGAPNGTEKAPEKDKKPKKKSVADFKKVSQALSKNT